MRLIESYRAALSQYVSVQEMDWFTNMAPELRRPSQNCGSLCEGPVPLHLISH